MCRLRMMDNRNLIAYSSEVHIYYGGQHCKLALNYYTRNIDIDIKEMIRE